MNIQSHESVFTHVMPHFPKFCVLQLEMHLHKIVEELVKTGFAVPVGLDTRYATLHETLRFAGQNAFAHITEATKAPAFDQHVTLFLAFFMSN